LENFLNLHKIDVALISEIHFTIRTMLEKNINLETRIKEPNELDEAVQNFATLIQQTAWHSTPVRTEILKELDNIPLYVK
jgi:hypothetical protein